MWQLEEKVSLFAELQYSTTKTSKIMAGLRPELPKNIATPLVTLVTGCWDEKPECRPTFNIIIAQLKWVLNEYTKRGTPKPTRRKKKPKKLKDRYTEDLLETDELDLLLLHRPNKQKIL